MISRIEILEAHGIRAVDLGNGVIIADTSLDENGKVYRVDTMTDKQFFQFLGY